MLRMTYRVLFEKIESGEMPPGFYYAHIPSLRLTTHGQGVEDAKSAAKELLQLWLEEKRAAGEAVPIPAEILFSTVEISDDALQSA